MVDGTPNAIWVEPDVWDPRYRRQPPPNISAADALTGHYVRVVGTFRLPARGETRDDKVGAGIPPREISSKTEPAWGLILRILWMLVCGLVLLAWLGRTAAHVFPDLGDGITMIAIFLAISAVVKKETGRVAHSFPSQRASAVREADRN